MKNLASVSGVISSHSFAQARFSLNEAWQRLFSVRKPCLSPLRSSSLCCPVLLKKAVPLITARRSFQDHSLVGIGGFCALVGGSLMAQQGISVSDPGGPKVIVPSKLLPQVFVLNGDASVSGFATANSSTYAMHCSAPNGLATSGTASLTLATDDRNNAVFQTGSNGSTPAAVGRGVPYNGSNCFNSAALALGGNSATAVLSAADASHKYLFVVANGSSGNADTITSYYTAAVAYTGSAVSMQQTGQAKLDTGGVYTSVVTDEDGNYGDAIVTEMRTTTSAGGTWLYNNVFGTSTKLLGPGGVDLPAVNSFIIHNPTDGGGGLLVLVNQDGLTAANILNPPLDTTPFTIIDLGQLHDLVVSKNNPKTLTLPSVTTISSTLGYYAMLGAAYNAGDRKIYAVVGTGTSTGNIQRLIVRYDPYNAAVPAETVVNDVSAAPLNGSQTTQLAINAANKTMEMLATDSNRVFTAGISGSGPAAAELLGAYFGDGNFVPRYLASNSLLGETYIASTAQVDIVTKNSANKMLVDLDMTANEIQASVGSGSVVLLGKFPDPYEAGLSTTNITITATPQGGGAAFTFATLTASSVTTLPRYVSGTFPSAGIYTLVASFPGDTAYAAGTSAPVTIAVGQALFATTTTATASFNSSTGAGAASVILAGTNYVPTGTIKVTSVNSGLTLATLFLSGPINNPMSIAFTAPPSTTAVKVAYSGDQKNQASSTGNVTLTQVALVTPVITVTGPSTGTVASQAHFTVGFTSTTTIAPTGNIIVFATSATQSFVSLGSVSAASAFAAGGVGLNWTPSTPDSYSINVQYAGDSNYNAVQTTQVGSIVVSGGTYTFTISSPTTAASGASFNVVVNASTGVTATGNITISAVKLGTTTQISLGTVSATTAANGGATLAASIASSGVYTLTGSYAGDANYPASASANAPTINVTGGTGAAVTLTPTSATLTAAVGSTGTKNFILYNTGSVGLTISNIATTGQGFGQFNGCPSPTLASGTNCTIAVQFNPGSPGTVNGSLVITDNATGSPHTATLVGVGVAGSAVVSPTTVTFIDQTVGTGSFLRPSVTLSNTGTAAFTITSATLSNTTDFEITTSQCSSLGTLTPGGTCTINVEFHPTSVGAKTATLTIATSNSTVPQTVTLTGLGLSGNPATPPNCTDTDGDGLCDDWETNGVWVRTSSTTEKFIDLPSMGADPKHKDIFVQADYMETAYLPAGDHSHQMTSNAAYQELLGFDQSPVPNPDGTTGIHLHVDCGPTCIMILKTKKLWGSLSLASGMQEQTLLDTIHSGVGVAFDWTKYDAASSVFLATGRSLIFHHAIMAHMQNSGNSSSGLSRNGTTFNLGASDIIVSFGGWTSIVGTDMQQAGTLMHELGHNLGLHHGGDLDDNYKPNYLSIMNYNFQTGGVVFDNGKGTGNGFFDYSRALLPALDETKLDEVNGLNANPTNFVGAKGLAIGKYGTYRFCTGDNPLKTSPKLVNYVNGNVNWDCDASGTISTTRVAQDINADGGQNVNYNGTIYALTSFNDWPALVYTGGAVGGNGVGQAPPTTTQAAEITNEQDSLIPRPYLVAIQTMGRVHSTPNSKMTLNVVIANTGTTDDTYALSASTVGGWPINTALPPTVSVPANGKVTLSLAYTIPSNANNGDKDSLVITAQSQNDDFVSDTKEVGLIATTSPLPDSLSAAQIIFGSQLLGGSSAAQSVTIMNTGGANLSFGAITTTSEFAQTNTCGTSLATGASCVVSVTFAPSAAGSRTGTLTINDGTGTAKTLALTGTGVTAGLPIPSVTLTVTPAATSTGQTVTFNVTVAGAAAAVPTGTVTVASGTTQIGQMTLDASGKGSFTNSTLGAGTYSLLASYSGDAGFRAATSPYTALVVTTATPTTVALTTSAAAVATGTSVTFTATLGGGSGASQPTGSVRFLDGTTQIGTGTLNASGVATFATSTLAAGAHSITAAYGGDNVFGGSVSGVVTETVGVFATTNRLTSSATTVVTGTSVTLTATLTSPAGTPTGTVTFLDGTTTLGTGTLNAGGVATYTTTALAIGTHSITSQYAATGNFGPSTSTAVQVIVTGVPDFAVAANPTSLTVKSGASGTAVFTVTPSNGYAGTLSFTCGTLPTYASCSFAPAKLTFTSTTQTAQTTTLTFSTTQASGMLRPAMPGRGTGAPISFALSVPLGLLALAFGWKGRRQGALDRLCRVLVLAAAASVAVLSGCASSASSPATTPAGTYAVPITVTDGTTSHSVTFSVTVN